MESSIYSGSSRVVRGGSWYFIVDYCTISDRKYGSPGISIYFYGFRGCR